jgi:formylglycine-generating enzyme required for sulfatase activity
VRKLYTLLIVTIVCFSKMLWADNYIEPTMVTLPAGEFSMGSKESDSEQPVHTVKISAFKLAKYDVTVKEFLQFTKATDYKPTGDCLFKGEKGVLRETPTQWGVLNSIYGEFISINCVSWKDTQAYIGWLSIQSGKHYRLPSEAEWEYAARAGSTKKFHFGDTEKGLCQYGNINDKTTSENIGRDLKWPDKAIDCDDHERILSTLGTYQPNKFALYDMIGNVSQWVADCYHANYQGAPKTGITRTDANCTTPFARGGAWSTGADSQRSAFRPIAENIGKNASQGSFDRGFRLALDIQDDKTITASELQKSFTTELTNKQRDALEHRKSVIKEHKAFLAKYKTLAKMPAIIPSMVNIPAGDFLMGSELFDKEKPIHKVHINAFKISKYEVTIKQFKQFVAATDYSTEDLCWKFVTEGGGQFKVGYDVAQGNWLTSEYAPSDFHPLMCVSWDDANAYLQWLSLQTGKKYRLPTEAEWEYAARAGSTTKYSFGDDDKYLCQYGNIFDISGMQAFVRDKNYQKKDMACEDGAEYTTVIGMYKPNAFGLYDMVGNVSEWVEDCDHENYQGAPTDGSAWISEQCSMRSRKGSSYGPGGGSHLSMRGHGGQTNRSSLGEGFRIAEDIAVDELCSNSSSACEKTTRKQNTFETELVKAQKTERTKRN